MILSQFNFLTPAELIILEEHLKLGMPHLKQQLTKSEVERLLGALSLSQMQIAKIGKSNTEISGNLSLVLNTIFTATFGAWIGYSAFWGLSLASFWIFSMIIAIAASVGVFIGYQSIRATKQQSLEATNKQRINLLQIEILKKLDQKRREEVAGIIAEVEGLFLKLSKGTSFKDKLSVLNLLGKSKREISDWALQVEEMGKWKLESCFRGEISSECILEWIEIQEELRRTAIAFFEEKRELEVIHDESVNKQEERVDSSLKKLISRTPKKSGNSISWIQGNLRSLMLGLAPTLLGSFSSLCVYLGGIPLILKNFGYEKSFYLLMSPKVKMAEFSISVVLTLYFGFSFAYANWSAFKRYREIKKTNETIIQMEALFTVLDVHIIKLKEFKNSSFQLIRFFKIVDKISKHFLTV